MRPIPVDGGGGCVEPTAETIASGEYPIARNLYIYVSASRLAENPALEASSTTTSTRAMTTLIGAGRARCPTSP